MTNQELKMLQSLPLEIKIEKSKARLREWIDHFGKENCYISYSGGKDSDVLVNLVRQEFPDIKIIFINTGMELPKIIKHVLKRKKDGWNLEIIQPKKRFKEIIEKYGYPVISKEQSQYIYQYKTAKSEKTKDTRLNGNKYGRGKISEKWKYLLDEDIKISDRCCYWLKKEPIARIEREREIIPIIGVMAEESSQRKSVYLQNGCNSFNTKRPISKPLGFWLEEDIWQYINLYGLEISEEYTVNSRCRTGCSGCLYGAHQQEKLTGDNNITFLKRDYPKLYDMYLNNYGYKKVMDILKLKY